MSPGLAVARRTQGAAKAHDSGDIMSDPPDLNLNDLEELVRDAFHVRDEAVPSDEVVRAQARIVKGCSTVTLQSGYWYLIEGEPPPWRETGQRSSSRLWWVTMRGPGRHCVSIT